MAEMKLHMTTFVRNEVKMNELLDSGIDINDPCENGTTALMWAATDNKTTMLENLLEKGANVNAQDKNGWTPLIVASTYNNVNAVKVLLNVDELDVNLSAWTNIPTIDWELMVKTHRN